MASTPAIEAKSLGLLTTIASDPPLYPRNPTQAPHAPITLYIVRVPGSRDVFLTPLKPREKVVSAEDVQSSLYFLHIDNPGDELVESVEEEKSPQGSPAPPITRRPLPTPPISPGIDSPRQRTPVYDSNHHLGVPQRKPVASGSFTRQSLDLPDIPPRQGQPTLSPQTAYYPRDDRSDDGRPVLSRRPLSNQFLDPRTISGRSSNRITSFGSGSASQSSSDAPMTPGEVENCVSLTLIRRDPTSGFQWNVAKIRDPPVHEISSDALGPDSISMLRMKKAGAPLFLEVCNPGYTKFVQSDKAASISRISMDMASPPLPCDDGIFRRRLWMDGSRFADHGYGHQMSSYGGEQQGQRSSVQIKRKSIQSSSKALVDRRSKGYSFRSPWGGKCEFSTGAAGRSLKCKHTLENPSSAILEVSELRFNLPTGIASRNPTNTDPGAKRSSFMARPRLHRYSTSDELNQSTVRGSADMANFLDEYGNIDMSLGQERAGGGFQGKQAKLGKLIIEDEGVKMLDLIVAANLALWWRAYEKS